MDLLIVESSSCTLTVAISFSQLLSFVFLPKRLLPFRPYFFPIANGLFRSYSAEDHVPSCLSIQLCRVAFMKLFSCTRVIWLVGSSISGRFSDEHKGVDFLRNLEVRFFSKWFQKQSYRTFSSLVSLREVKHKDHIHTLRSRSIYQHPP